MNEVLEFTEPGLAKRKRSGFAAKDMKALWEQVKLSPDQDEKYVKLIQGIRTMISHLGDTSNLILDPDLDSYYLMDIVLLALPQTQDRLQNLAVYLSKMKGEEKEKTQLAIEAAFLKESDLIRILADAQTSINEDDNFYGKSESLQKNLLAALTPYQQSVEKIDSQAFAE